MSATGQDDLLAEICDKGTVTVSTDPAYPPQSSLNEKTGEYEGFDIDVATEIAKRLGVDDRLGDAGLGRHHRRRLERPLGHERRLDDADQRPAEGARLHPAVLLHAGRRRGRTRTTPTSQDLTTDLDGKKIGVCSGCTYEEFLDKTLAIKGYTFNFVIDDAKVTGYDTDTTRCRTSRSVTAPGSTR